MEFLNSIFDCPLSSAGHFALTEFLAIPNPPSREIFTLADFLLEETNDEEEPLLIELDPAPDEKPGETSQRTNNVLPEKPSESVLSLSSQCMAELLQVEQSGKLATDLLNVETTPYDTSNQPSNMDPVLPHHVTENLQNAMHTALMKVMAERDEAHAQLVSASVLHTHTLEQERKKVERLEAKLEHANKMLAQRNGVVIPRFIGLDKKKAQEEQEERDKLQKKQMEMQANSDAEIVALCEQLSSEISSRTQAALEVIRLKENRSIERKHEIEEKEALRDELIRVKEMLAQEQQNSHEARQDADRWKQYYERATSDEWDGEVQN
jgi:tetrahydromethanopterin S-methyltransferase subunit G